MTLALTPGSVVENSPCYTGDSFHSIPAFERSPEGTELQRWQCPYCSHDLTFQREDRDVAELAVRSHMTRRHWAVRTTASSSESAPASLIDLTNVAPGSPGSVAFRRNETRSVEPGSRGEIDVLERE